MKKFLLFIGLLWAAGANAQFTPGQLLTAGELNTQFALYAELASATFTGPVTIPTLTVTTTATLPSQSANTLLGNTSGSSAPPTAVSVGNCSNSSSALSYTAGTGFGCNSSVNAATLGGATFAAPPAAGYGSTTPEPVAATTITATSTITPSQTSGIVGTTTNNNANAGSVGEYVTNTTTGTSLPVNTGASVASISLTAGDWDVEGIIQTVPAGTTTQSLVATGISTSSTAFQVLSGSFLNIQELAVSVSAGLNIALATPRTRISLSSTTTIYLVAQVNYAVSTLTCNGFIRARRVR